MFNEKMNTYLFYGLLGIVVYILIYNILFYNPILGYDALAHNAYVDYLAMYLPKTFNLPDQINTREFFNPPIGYIVPSVAQVICRNIIDSIDYVRDCKPVYGVATQIFQSVLYVVTIFINLYTLKIINNSKKIVNFSYLILISILAVNYRTISMIRGEPYIIFFLSLFLLLIQKAKILEFEFSYKQIIFCGIVIGGIALSRQWGFLLFPPLIILIFSKETINKFKYIKFWTLSGLLGFIMSGWFYIRLYLNYGTFTAFNMNSNGFSLTNQPLSFYFPSLENISHLFSKPIRPYLDNQFLSILYSDLWGDYWGYFVFTSRFLDFGRGQELIGDYLGRVNLVSLFAFLIIIYLYVKANNTNKNKFILKYINLAVLSSFIGYLIFTISYPVDSGDTIKATYIIQLFHLIVFMASIHLEKLKRSNEKFYNILTVTLGLVFVHNFQTYLSHFPQNFYESYINDILLNLIVH
mgnify:CR=1 FL=1